MRRIPLLITVLALGTCLLVPMVARTAADPDAENRAAVSKAVPILEKGSAGYIKARGCFSCHHQALPVLALVAARNHGFTVDAVNLKAQVDHTEADLRGNIASYREGKGQGGGITRAGYATWALAAGGWQADETTGVVAGFVLQREGEGAWRSSSNRPPSEASSFTSTFLALRTLQAYAAPAEAERVAARTEKVKQWLLATPATDTEDRVFRLWSLRLAHATDEELQTAAKQLLDTQREDGGWSQKSDLESDAYATGSALVALHEGGGVSASDPAYRKGLAFLVKTQLPDGSWHVVTRSKPFQPYFESGFPHGKDQWISCAATSWAVWALSLGF